jgi:hypothetical protein
MISCSSCRVLASFLFATVVVYGCPSEPGEDLANTGETPSVAKATVVQTDSLRAVDLAMRAYRAQDSTKMRVES